MKVERKKNNFIAHISFSAQNKNGLGVEDKNGLNGLFLAWFQMK